MLKYITSLCSTLQQAFLHHSMIAPSLIDHSITRYLTLQYYPVSPFVIYILYTLVRQQWSLISFPRHSYFSGANALSNLEKKDNPAVVALPFKRNAGLAASSYRRRGSGEVEILFNNGPSLYTVDITLGTPPHTRVQIDTGSSDLVVETTKSNFCKRDPTVCSDRGACKCIWFECCLNGFQTLMLKRNR